MKDFANVKDGQTLEALICVTDLTGYAKMSREHDLSFSLSILKDVAEMTAKAVKDTPGHIVKYLGDASLIIFPNECVDGGIRVLLGLKKGIDEHLARKKLSSKVTALAHYGEIIVGRLEPFDSIDILGEAVNIAFTLDRGQHRGRLVISPQAFRKLKPETRKSFHKFTPPTVYLSE